MPSIIVHKADSLHAEKPEEAVPRYRSHKVVYALKIGEFLASTMTENGIGVFRPEDQSLGIDCVYTSRGWLSRFAATDSDLGYWVQYEDGFESWSPSEAFENGYQRLQPSP